MACCRAARHVLPRRRVREDSAFTIRHRRRSSPAQSSSPSLFSLCFCLRVFLCFYHDISRLPGWLAASHICQHDCIMSQMVRRPCDSGANQSLSTVRYGAKKQPQNTFDTQQHEMFSQHWNLPNVNSDEHEVAL